MKKTAKTKFFREGFEPTDEFLPDFKAFLELPEEVVHQLRLRIRTRDDLVEPFDKIIGSISQETGYSPAKISNGISIISFFANVLREEETVQDLQSDLELEGFIVEDNKQAAKVIFQNLNDAINLIRERGKEKSSEGKGALSLKSVSTVADLRLHAMAPFSLEDSVEAYKPEIKKLIPIGIIRISAEDPYTTETFSFQCNMQNLEYFVNKLTALKKELALLEKLEIKQ